MSPRSSAPGARAILQIALGVFLVILGIQGINAYMSAGSKLLRGVLEAFGETGHIINLVMAIIELTAGIVLLIAVVGVLPPAGKSLLVMIVFIFWAFGIVYTYFMAREVLGPKPLEWLAGISRDAIILVSIWLVRES